MQHPEIYICDCGHEANVPANSGLPNGWIKKQAGVAGIETVILCSVCADFEEVVTAYEDARTHDSSSAINDEPAPLVAVASAKTRLWLVTLTFATDKGTVETNWPALAGNALDAMQQVKMGGHAKNELVRIVVTPAPQDMQSSGFAPSLQSHEKITA